MKLILKLKRAFTLKSEFQKADYSNLGFRILQSELVMLIRGLSLNSIQELSLYCPLLND